MPKWSVWKLEKADWKEFVDAIAVAREDEVELYLNGDREVVGDIYVRGIALPEAYIVAVTMNVLKPELRALRMRKAVSRRMLDNLRDRDMALKVVAEEIWSALRIPEEITLFVLYYLMDPKLRKFVEKARLMKEVPKRWWEE